MNLNRPPESSSQLSPQLSLLPSFPFSLSSLLRHSSQKLAQQFHALKCEAFKTYTNVSPHNQALPTDTPKYFSTHQQNMNVTISPSKNPFLPASTNPKTSPNHKIPSIFPTISSFTTTIIILFFLIIFITPSFTHKVSKTIFDHPLKRTSFHLFTETEGSGFYN